jgi:hypothetical protein
MGDAEMHETWIILSSRRHQEDVSKSHHHDEHLYSGIQIFILQFGFLEMPIAQ